MCGTRVFEMAIFVHSGWYLVLKSFLVLLTDAWIGVTHIIRFYAVGNTTAVSALLLWKKNTERKR